jgi:hypothetical protein
LTTECQQCQQCQRADRLGLAQSACFPPYFRSRTCARQLEDGPVSDVRGVGLRE